MICPDCQTDVPVDQDDLLKSHDCNGIQTSEFEKELCASMIHARPDHGRCPRCGRREP